jgi:hypothetical protein
LLRLRLLPPRSYRLRHRPPEWEIVDESGAVVGWLEERHLPTSGRPFYSLVAVHPITGEAIPLELSTDRDERLAKLAAFLAEPDRFAQHYPSGSLARTALEGRLGGPAWRFGTGRGGRHG